MRALTIKQPWASLIMSGVKDVENRSWPVPSTLPQWARCEHCGARRQQRGWWEPVGAVCKRNAFGRERAHVTVLDGPFPFRLWIHAGKGWDEAGHEALVQAEDEGRIPAQGFGDLPSGALLGLVTCIRCHWADECWKWNPIAPGAGGGGKPIARDGERPGWCSRFAEPDCYHWTLTDPQPFPEPIPLKGRQGLWTLPADVAVPA